MLSILADIIKSLPTAFLIFWTISTINLVLFSSLPPYSSVLLLYFLVENNETKVKCPPWISIPSKPAFLALIAAWTNKS